MVECFIRVKGKYVNTSKPHQCWTLLKENLEDLAEDGKRILKYISIRQDGNLRIGLI
jgi:hypothetical protein